MMRHFTIAFLIPDKLLTTVPGPLKGWGSPCSKMSIRVLTEVKNILTLVVNFNSICGRSLAGIVGSNPAGVVEVRRECCVLSSRGLCVGAIPRPEESYRVCGVSECDREASIMRGPWHTTGVLISP